MPSGSTSPMTLVEMTEASFPVMSRNCGFLHNPLGVTLTITRDGVMGLPRWYWWYKKIYLPVQEMQEMGVQSLGWEDPLEEGMGTHSSFLAWKIPWTQEPGGLQFMVLQRVRHD